MLVVTVHASHLRAACGLERLETEGGEVCPQRREWIESRVSRKIAGEGAAAMRPTQISSNLFGTLVSEKTRPDRCLYQMGILIYAEREQRRRANFISYLQLVLATGKSKRKGNDCSSSFLATPSNV